MSQDFLDIQYLSDSGVESTEDDDEEHEFTTWQIFRPTSLQFYKNNHYTEIQPCSFRKMQLHCKRGNKNESNIVFRNKSCEEDPAPSERI